MAAIHHYVPRLLLKNFCADDRPQICAFDKKTGKAFRTNIQNVAGERNYYEMTVGEDTIALEAALSSVEAEAAPLVDRIVNERNIGWLSSTDRQVIAAFVAVQMKRGPHVRENFVAMDAAFRKALGDRWGIPTEGHPGMTADRAKHMALSSMTSPDQYSQHILNKTWLLFETRETPFYVSDNPVVLQNEDESQSPLRGTLGLAVPGIQIYLPISSSLTLAFFCRSHEASIRQSVERIRLDIVRDPAAGLGFGPTMDWMRAFRKGTPLSSQADNVLNHNSLQVMFSERYVFCRDLDFSLAEEMIAEHPEVRGGRHLELG